MTFDMNGKTAVITGAAGGIGAAVARRFAEAGYTLVLGDLNAVALEELAGELAALTTVHALTCDVSKPAECENLMATAAADAGRLDVLVNTAGVWTEGPSDETTEEEWDRTIDVNLKGTFFCCRHAIPQLKKTRGLHRQPEQRRRRRRHARDGRLHGLQGRRLAAHQVARARAGARRSCAASPCAPPT